MPIGEDFPNSANGIIGFTLPRLHTGKSWYVDFFSYDPVSNRMKRKKYMLDRTKKHSERRIMGTLLIAQITQRLLRGWNPWVRDDSTRHLTEFDEVVRKYCEYVTAMETQGALKHKTAYDYLSRVGTLTTYIQECNVAIRYIYQFDRSFVVDYLDYLILDKDVSATTRNNHRTWLSTFGSWLVERSYLSANPVEGTHMLREKEKRRDALSAGALARMRVYLYNNNKPFLLACMMEYYTFIRPDELRHIRVGDVSVSEKEVRVPAEVSKNHKERHVGINSKVLQLMIELRVFDAPSQYYLFGKELKPGPEMTYLNRFRYEWKKMRQALRWPASYQFYSLKDSGIRDLANAAGVVVARDQAGHSDIAVTNRYLKRNSTIPESVKEFDGSL
ncbi:MAG: site-specific integrase [Prevotella sp.]|nr:site-specific integrase [Prevotella sp.]